MWDTGIHTVGLNSHLAQISSYLSPFSISAILNAIDWISYKYKRMSSTNGGWDVQGSRAILMGANSLMETLSAESLGGKGQTVQTYSLLHFFVVWDHEHTCGCFHHLLTSNSEQFPEALLHIVLICNNSEEDASVCVLEGTGTQIIVP